METVEEHPVITTEIDVVKLNIIEELSADESNVCHKTNGVDCAESTVGEGGHPDADVPAEKQSQPDLESQPESHLLGVETEKPENVTISDNVEPILDSTEAAAAPESELESPMDQTDAAIEVPDSNTESEVLQGSEISPTDEIPHEVTTETVEESEKEICIEEGIITETIVEMESSVSTVHFETEVVVEKNDNEVDSESMVIENQGCDQANNILNELGPNIELSEVLRSSDVSENVENNNSSVKQEIFNKEELLDILEGNDDTEQPIPKVSDTSAPNVNRDAERALLQLSRLSRNSRKKSDLKSPKIKRGEKTKSPIKDASKGKNMEKEKQQTLVEEKKQLDNKLPENHADSTEESQLDNEEQDNKVVDKEQDQEDKKQLEILQTDQDKTQTDSIVKSLVMDWEDEPTENNEISIIQEGEDLIKDLEELKKKQESIVSNNDSLETSVKDSPSVELYEESTKIDIDSRTRRISRVIKKKVIFDPDNPDTFTKGKSKPKEAQVPKEPTPSKKPKLEQVIQRSKSKSPLSKLQWKKPSAKNSKQHRRLTEVDKLLMDEGAVNMIYQLTPEASKGKKNVRTKAEFIKKLQSSTPDSKEMKFRERKKECKYEEGEAKKLLGGKHRPTLSSSVKSPCVSEDFETHSADDSIIYRRHSSSSYSSSCMSPRRLSDVEAGSTQSQVTRISQPPTPQHETVKKPDNEETVFQSGLPKESSNEMINKNDSCLSIKESIKEKLNSKLSLALNKRKRENSKIEKPAKQKKHESVTTSSREDRLDQFKYISVTFDQRLAIVCIKKTGVKICVEILKELEEALNLVDNRQDISITLLESQCGTLCSSLDLSLLLGENKEIIANHAYELAESVRSLLVVVAQHSKLVCCGVWGACAGVALALVALSDVALASEGASFWLAAAAAPVLPGAAALTARCRPLPQALVNDLVIFGRRLSATEALQGGLVSRVLWPDRFDEQVQSVARDIAAQPLQTILLKKRLLSLKSNSEAELTFLSSLEMERDLLVQYWTSVEGQELLRATLDAA
ncbi:muscle M-line assembly protein unc-89 [Bicyclus anynana]|uniref:Muscle M-line assembly protein unc-89 n=1 Tax=Bicyclus anynana TaxID=110368 RepID=A0A6J1MGD8_BICAN|nr:muscle M-line assembly protein unc-89 [Bicyclus anynana]